MKRLDKYLVDCGIGSRSEVKEYIKKGFITVNDTVNKKSDSKIGEDDLICFKGKALKYEKYVYYMLNKPQGVISATEDPEHKTVIDLLKKENKRDLFPVGRLDKDTEGLLIITNDGLLGHKLTSPKYAIEKSYYLQSAKDLTEEMIHSLEAGVDIGEDKLTLPARVEKISNQESIITITEGKFHQVKRMYEAVGNKVIFLKRISMGEIKLDPTLEKGSYRRLSREELDYLLSI